MNADRIKLVLDNYAAHFAPPAETPACDQRRASAHARAHFDLNAADFSAMIRESFCEAVPLINYAGSVQPLNGLYLLSGQAPDALRQALTTLLSVEGTLDEQQARMQRFCEDCNLLLSSLAPSKRAWEQNIRSAMALLALLKPAAHYLYKSTECRAFADMIGFGLDVTAGSAFRVGNYYALGDAMVQVIRRHEGLMALLGDAEVGDLHLVVYDIIMNAPAAKWGLFGDLQPLIKSRSRAGQANQERAQRISRMQLEITLMQSRRDAITKQIGDLPTPNMVGQHFRSSAFGEVEAIRQEDGRLTIRAGNSEKRMALPMSILQGFLVPLNDSTLARYEQERTLLNQRHTLEIDIRNKETEMNRLQSKP